MAQFIAYRSVIKMTPNAPHELSFIYYIFMNQFLKPRIHLCIWNSAFKFPSDISPMLRLNYSTVQYLRITCSVMDGQSIHSKLHLTKVVM